MKYLVDARGLDFIVYADVVTKPRYLARGQIVGEKVITYDYLDGYNVENIIVQSIERPNKEEVTYSKYPRLHAEILLHLVEQIEEPA